MINNEQFIPCPVCNTRIPFDVHQLLQGIQFSCPVCMASVGLATESKEIVRQTIKKFEDIKGKIDKK